MTLSKLQGDTEYMMSRCVSDYDSFEGLKSILRETVLMNQCDHPNVLSVLGVSLDTDNEGGLPFIVLPFMANGDLKAYLKSRRMNNSGVDQLPEVFTMYTNNNYDTVLIV